jgi:hypothetical protein
MPLPPEFLGADELAGWLPLKLEPGTRAGPFAVPAAPR